MGGRRRLSLAGQNVEGLEHDPEKWNPAFRKDHAQTKKPERDADRTIAHPALDNPRLVTLPITVTQQALVKLAGRQARQLGLEID
jgi:hypothetical protein